MLVLYLLSSMTLITKYHWLVGRRWCEMRYFICSLLRTIVIITSCISSCPLPLTFSQIIILWNKVECINFIFLLYADEPCRITLTLTVEPLSPSTIFCSCICRLPRASDFKCHSTLLIGILRQARGTLYPIVDFLLPLQTCASQ